jgi:hypothetical protein
MMAAVQGNVEVSRISRNVVFDTETEINRGVPANRESLRLEWVACMLALFHD